MRFKIFCLVCILTLMHLGVCCNKSIKSRREAYIKHDMLSDIFPELLPVLGSSSIISCPVKNVACVYPMFFLLCKTFLRSVERRLQWTCTLLALFHVAFTLCTSSLVIFDKLFSDWTLQSTHFYFHLSPFFIEIAQLSPLQLVEPFWALSTFESFWFTVLLTAAYSLLLCLQ